MSSGKVDVILSEEQKRLIEAELSKENNVEIMNTPKGVIIKRIKRETVNICPRR